MDVPVAARPRRGAGRWAALALALGLVGAHAAADRAAAAPTLVYDRGSADSLSAAGGLSEVQPFRPAILPDDELLGMTAAQIAWTLRAEIDRERDGSITSHVIAIDEIGNAFRDPPPTTRYKLVKVRGRRYRIAAHNHIRLTEHGWTLVRRPPTPQEPRADHPGRRLSRALEIMAGWPSPWGGSYADGVQLLISPAMVTAIGVGNGEFFTLNRAGSRQVRRGWRGVLPALTRAGGVWLEMYHGGRRALSLRQWRQAPGRIADYVEREGGDPSRVHLLVTAVQDVPEGMGTCADPMPCQWAAARSSERTRAVLRNGVGAYRLEDDAAAFRTGWEESAAD